MLSSDGGSLVTKASEGHAGTVSRDVCPLCGSTARTRFRAIERGGSTYQLEQCSNCGFVYTSTARFDTADHGDLSKLYWRFRSRHHQIRRLIHLHLKPGSQIVEIGCGRGELGYIMKDDPYGYTGYEPASGLSRFGQQHGVNVVHDLDGAELARRATLDSARSHQLFLYERRQTDVRPLRPASHTVRLPRADLARLSVFCTRGARNRKDLAART